MHSRNLISLSLLMTLASAASASSFVATTDTLGSALAGSAEATSDATSSLRDSKVVHAAQDDAASFVASNGELRGARLEAALRYLRSQSPDLHSASDLQLAGAILSR
ncbi:DUF2388 domain-containing protein [Pseudomonas sp. UBA6323]|uniref:DUF2388 domain-containing protein n=1 Tax=Pseudomonas sp. UBA6323 TaxID=1947329 RepID=UPI0025F0F09C|nr:DUF2388 domain-containing protein [Pseudomonas sp. UBA6323]